MAVDCIDYWYNEKLRLGALLERYEVKGDISSWNELYPAYVTACDEYRNAVFDTAPFTGVMF